LGNLKIASLFHSFIVALVINVHSKLLVILTPKMKKKLQFNIKISSIKLFKRTITIEHWTLRSFVFNSVEFITTFRWTWIACWGSHRNFIVLIWILNCLPRKYMQKVEKLSIYKYKVPAHEKSSSKVIVSI